MEFESSGVQSLKISRCELSLRLLRCFGALLGYELLTAKVTEERRKVREEDIGFNNSMIQ
jgi:hypothetical protein